MGTTKFGGDQKIRGALPLNGPTWLLA